MGTAVFIPTGAGLLGTGEGELAKERGLGEMTGA